MPPKKTYVLDLWKGKKEKRLNAEERQLHESLLDHLKKLENEKRQIVLEINKTINTKPEQEHINDLVKSITLKLDKKYPNLADMKQLSNRTKIIQDIVNRLKSMNLNVLKVKLLQIIESIENLSLENYSKAMDIFDELKNNILKR